MFKIRLIVGVRFESWWSW